MKKLINTARVMLAAFMLLALNQPIATAATAISVVQPQYVPVYRLANWQTHERLFTTSAAERDNAVAHLAGWVDEGTAFWTVPGSTSGAAPVYRLANWQTHERLFTTSSAERDNAAAHLPGWVDESTAFWTMPGGPTSITVYRLANWQTHERLFTVSAAERDNAVTHLPGWVSEGTAFYASNPTASNPVIPPANLLPNPSVESTSGGAPDGWTADGWGTNTRSFAHLSTGHNGSHSLQTTVTAYSSGDAKWHANPVAVVPGRMYQYADYYQSAVDTQFVAAFTDMNGSITYLTLKTIPPSTDWQKVSAEFTVPAGSTSVSVYHLLSRAGQLVTDDASLTAYTPVGFSRGLISFTFDDAWRSIYDYGLPLLAQANIPSTQYLLTGYTGNPEYMTLQMMQAFQAQGSEIASHTIDHPHLPTLSLANLQQELFGSKAWLESNLTAMVTDFASPYGEYNGQVIAQVKAAGYASHRSTDVGFNARDTFDPYGLKVQNIDSSTSVAQVQDWISEAVATHTWLVLVYHQVLPTAPADGGGEGNIYWTTPADLQSELSVAKTSGLGIVTVSGALAEITPQLTQ